MAGSKGMSVACCIITGANDIEGLPLCGAMLLGSLKQYAFALLTSGAYRGNGSISRDKMTTPTHQHATILEVAREAGASKTSVSRYFSGERERLSPNLQTSIAAAAQRLGYHPNRMASGLKGGGDRGS